MAAIAKDGWTGQKGIGECRLSPGMDVNLSDFWLAILEKADELGLNGEQLITQLRYMVWMMDRQVGIREHVMSRKEAVRTAPVV